MDPTPNALSGFDSQRYPTVEQTIVNNASVLYKRKKFFLQDLRLLIKGVGFVLIGMCYLRDLSMLGFAIRAFNQYSLSNPYPVAETRLLLTDESKEILSKYLLVQVLASNVFFFFCHILFGIYKESPSADNYLHGGITVQFIGEKLPSSVLELLALDIFILFFQLLFHTLMCVTDDSEILESKLQSYDLDDEESVFDRREVEADGYNGNVNLISVDLTRSVLKVLDSLAKFQIPSRMTRTTEQAPPPAQTPGAFV